jgi:DNA-binding CsgD family transcriptional regulator
MIENKPTGWRACLRRRSTWHHPNFKPCDCMRRKRMNRKTLTQRIIDAINAGGLMSAYQIARKLKADPATVSGILARLRAAGRVTGLRAGVDCLHECCAARKPGTWVY